MKTTTPSIFNDVIGPVMRGPSSSHCSAALRIGRIVRDLMHGEIEEVLIEFDPRGSLASTHRSQGSDMGLFAGLLGWSTTDERMVNSPELIREAGIRVHFRIAPLEVDHPNVYKITAQNSRERHTVIAVSRGGGIIEVVEIDGIRLSLAGDYYETILFIKSGGERVLQYLRENIQADEILLLGNERLQMVEIKAQQFLPPDTRSTLETKFAPISIREISPVLPVLSRRGMKVPFLTCAEMLAYNQDKQLDLWELAVHYERARGALSEEQVLSRMREIIGIMEKSIKRGLAGTDYPDRILGYQSGTYQQRMAEGRLLDAGMLNRMILYTTALMESKSGLEVIVAAPTAGSCGGLPGAVIAAGHTMGLSGEEMARAMLAAGMIGVFIAAHATFSAEVGGCQAECGAGSGMAAAALVTLAGGSTRQAVNAASLALQSTLGMICDPVANRVEVPCLGKNVLAASNALACANMALADFDPVIPLDEVIQTMDAVGRMLPSELCCTAHGGLSVTPTSREIEKRLEQKKGKKKKN